MTDRASIYETAAACERYWLATRVPRRRAAEMRLELETHLSEALAAGRDVSTVIGDDLPTFAEAWAAEQRRGGRRPVPSWDEVFRQQSRIGTTGVAILVTIAVLAVVAAGIWGRGGNSDMDNEIWRWIWIGAAAVFGVGEIFTAGFFMLPFAVGALAALPLAWFEVNEIVQLVVFLVVSIAALLVIQALVKKSDEHQPAVGANRFLHRTAIVTEPVDRTSGTGRVRVDTESWRATTDGESIPEGTEVKITDVRGTRLVVEPD